MSIDKRLSEIQARLTPETDLSGMLRPDEYVVNSVELLTVTHEKEAIQIFTFLESAHKDLTFTTAALREALDALSRLQKIHGEYLGNGGLFNPELMVLSGNELRDLLRIAPETLESIQRLVGSDE